MDSYTSPLMVAIYAIIAILGTALIFGVVIPQIPTRSIWKMFLGVQVPPLFVAFLRRAVTALATMIVTGIAVRLGIGGDLDVAAVAGSVWGLIELMWGVLDQSQKAGQNDAHPNPPAGATPGGAIDAEA